MYLTDCLDRTLLDRPSAGIIICGDLNKLDIKPVCNRFNLRKCVRTPTRGANILDQLLTNMHMLYDDVKHLPPLGNSDHQCLLMKGKETLKTSALTKKVREMKPGNFAQLSIALNNENWSDVLTTECIDDKVSSFTKTLTHILDSAMPMRSVRVHPSDKP